MHTITPRIIANDAKRLVDFIKRVFNATGEYLGERPSEIAIGDSMILISDSGERAPMTAFLYVYVDDPDAAYRTAIDAGARSIEAPFDTHYGDRRAMFEDRWGNTWQVAARITDAIGNATNGM